MIVLQLLNTDSLRPGARAAVDPILGRGFAVAAATSTPHHAARRSTNTPIQTSGAHQPADTAPQRLPIRRIAGGLPRQAGSRTRSSPPSTAWRGAPVGETLTRRCQQSRHEGSLPIAKKDTAEALHDEASNPPDEAHDEQPGWIIAAHRSHKHQGTQGGRDRRGAHPATGGGAAPAASGWVAWWLASPCPSALQRGGGIRGCPTPRERRRGDTRRQSAPRRGDSLGGWQSVGRRGGTVRLSRTARRRSRPGLPPTWPVPPHPSRGQ